MSDKFPHACGKDALVVINAIECNSVINVVYDNRLKRIAVGRVQSVSR